MEKLSDIQKEELKIMRTIDSICTDKKMKYMLSDGTLLGAIRHKGFIPWDDDMDIAMNRDEFEKFDSLLRSGYLNPKDYHYQSFKTYKYYPSEATKVRTNNVHISEKVSRTQKGYFGAWVDIFPYDNVPDDYKLRVQQFNKIHKYNRILYFSLLIRETDRDKGIKKFAKKIFRLINEILHPVYFFIPIIVRKRHEVITQYNTIETSEKANFGYMFYENYEEFSRTIVPAEVFDDLIELEFHGYKFLGPTRYDEILTRSYGDYMKIPDIEEREVHDIIIK